MDICILHRSGELPVGYTFPFLRGRLSYKIRGENLLSDITDDSASGGIAVIATDFAEKNIVSHILFECTKRKYSAVFLDSGKSASEKSKIATAKMSEELSRNGVKVFCPFRALSFCRGAIPVADISVSGGSFEEYATRLSGKVPKAAFFIPRISEKFTMPARETASRRISREELSRIIAKSDSDAFFSSQLCTKYLIYPSEGDGISYVLFDDAHTISKKLRLCERLGADTVFLAHSEISDIAGSILL